MNKSTLMMMVALASGSLMGQTAKEVADSLALQPLAPGATQLPLPQVPEGATIRLGGADFEQIIAPDGSINAVISDTAVQVFFKVTKDGETVNSKDYEVVVKPGAAPAAEGANPKPNTIPAILQWQGGKGVVDLKSYKDGLVIICNKGGDAIAKELAAELEAELGVPVKVQRHTKRDLKETTPVIRLHVSSARRAKHAKGLVSLGNEGYEMRVNGPVQVKRGKKGPKAGAKVEVADDAPTYTIAPHVLIESTTETGLFWGTRTLLQIVHAQGGKLPEGHAVDFPRYGVRGFMLDIARTPYSLQDLYRVVDLMAWYKMNDLHLVINNNYIFHEDYVKAGRDPFKESYSAFRLESKVKGEDGTPLTAQDVSYSKKEFRELIDYAKAHGVNIVPEFDTPGHALSFTRVRPDLIYKGPMPRHPHRRCEMLDAANPETLKFVGSVFDEYLLPENAGQQELTETKPAAKDNRAVFDGCVVHVGSDEFFGAPEDYRRYTDGILRHVLDRGYTPRVWGSLSAKKGNTPVVVKGVQMNLWSAGWMNVQEAVDLGYDVINTNDGALYIVPFANYYRMDKNHKWVYEKWMPNRIGGAMLPAGHPQLIGATFAVWNDMTDLRHNGYGTYDIWGIMASSMDVLGQRMWGGATPPDSYDEHRKLAAAISCPGLCKGVAEKVSQEVKPGKLPYELGKAEAALMPEYHVTLEVELEEVRPDEEQALLSGEMGELLAVMKDGSIGFRRADGMEFAWGAKLPVGKVVVIEVIGTPGKTRLIVDGQEVEALTLNSYRSLDEAFAKRTKGLVSSFVLPLHVLGKSFRGKVHSVKIERK